MLDGSTIVAGLLLVLLAWSGGVLRERSSLLVRLFIPGSLLAGAIGLALGPEVAGRITGTDGLWPAAVRETWAELPGLLISVVFAALFLGERIPTPRQIWRLAGPQVAFGQTMAWGQYCVGLLLALLVLGPVFALPPVAGTLIEIGFEGGHGTSAGMAGAFDAVGFPEGTDLALGLATIGILAAVLIGVAFVNWAVRSGRVSHETLAAGDGYDGDREGDGTREDREDGVHLPAGWMLLHVPIAIAAAIAIGWLLLQGLQALEDALWASQATVIAYMPLFPFAMLGGITVQVALMRAGRTALLDRRTASMIRRLALDLLITAAIATLALTTIAADIVPFLLLAVAGIVWSLFALLVLAPRMLPDWWVERAAADLGQSLGMTATGLLLLRVADPADRSPVLGAFGYKQLLFEPIVGGGLFTAASVPLVASFGGWPVLAFVAVLMVGWLILGLYLFGTRRSAAL
jgi:glutamate:Na+ symporter, ESS family